MGQHLCLVYVTIQNSDNFKKYIPIIRKFNSNSLSEIEENIICGGHVISFDWDRANSEQKKNFVDTLENLIKVGAELTLFKDFYVEPLDREEKRAITLEPLKDAVDMLEMYRYVRTPVKMKQLVKFSEEELMEYALYVAPDVETINADTMLYLDDYVEVDDDLNEIYPPFATENKLWIYFHGDIASSIIWNTRYQLFPKIPSIDDYIVNFNYYSEHDAYYNFE